MRTLLLLAVLLTSGCNDRHSAFGTKTVCYRDSDGLTWTNPRLMRSYASRREQINGGNLCYPHVGLTGGEIERGKRCPHPKQQIVDGWCRCVPYPDVLFTDDDRAKWCIDVKEVK